MAQLDRVPRVGASVFGRLFAYALAIGRLCPDGSVHGISECSGEAEAILELVNYASLEELDVEVGLDQRAAIHIVDHRAGEDGYAWTGDENPFNSLAELDAVPYVDTDAFSKLLAFVDPEPVDLAELRTRFVFDLRAELTGLYGVFGEDIASAGGNSLRRARRAVTEELVEEVLQTENDSLSHDLEWFVVFRHPDTIFPESDWWWFGVYDRRSGQLEGIYDDIPSLF